jgi:hypothetical protein
VSFTPDPRARDDDITSDRRETKYLVPVARADALVSALCDELPLHRFSGERANSLPGANHYITTVYFDTPSGRHYREASTGGRSIKVRAREYYDVHPSLAEVATSAGEIVRYDPWLWFELKRREAGRSEKRRFRLPKPDVPAFFASRGTRPLRSPPDDGVGYGSVPPAPPDAIEAYLRSLDEPLAATCLVNYRRVSWQSVDATLRVTLDLGLACYAAPADLWTREWPLAHHLLGRPTSVLDGAVLEVKARASVPPWLAAAIDRTRVASIEFSKFVAATRRLRENV